MVGDILAADAATGAVHPEAPLSNSPKRIRFSMAAIAIPDLIAHRGWASRFPENSLEALAAALDAGARFVEFDVQMSADDVPVLMHDATLNRTADVVGCIHDMTWPALASRSVGEPRRLGGSFPDARVPSLAEALGLLRQRPGRQAFVEIKTESLQRFGISRVLEHCLAAIREAPGQCIVTSYSDQLVQEVRNVSGLPIAWVLASHDASSLERAHRLAPEYLFCNVTKLPPGTLAKGSWDWAIYEVTDPQLALDLARRGVAYIETMAIGEMLSDPRLAGARA
jgi:glycerophosphoryl diester phosphodiesterase